MTDTQDTQTRALVKADRQIAIKDTAGSRRALVSRFGDADFGKALPVEVFIALCNKVGLNPWLGHISPYEGRPYIHHDGWVHLINREAPGQLVELDARPASREERETYGVAPGDYFAIGWCVRKWPNGNSIKYTRRAVIAKRLAEESENERDLIARKPRAKRRPIVEDPWDMALKQARTRAMRMGFNDVLVRSATALVEVDEETGEIIEGEAIERGPGDGDWSRLWVKAKELGMEKANVHAYFDAGPEDGDLKELGLKKALEHGVSLQQQIEDWADELEFSQGQGGAVASEPAPIPRGFREGGNGEPRDSWPTPPPTEQSDGREDEA